MWIADLEAVPLISDDLGTGPGHQDPPSLALTSGPDCLAYHCITFSLSFFLFFARKTVTYEGQYLWRMKKKKKIPHMGETNSLDRCG